MPLRIKFPKTVLTYIQVDEHRNVEDEGQNCDWNHVQRKMLEPPRKSKSKSEITF